MVGELQHLRHRRGLDLADKPLNLPIHFAGSFGGSGEGSLGLVDLGSKNHFRLLSVLCFPCVSNLLPRNADGSLQQGEVLQLHAIPALRNNIPEDGIQHGLRHCKLELAKGVLGDLAASKRVLDRARILREEALHFLQLVVCPGMSHGLLLRILSHLEGRSRCLLSVPDALPQGGHALRYLLGLVVRERHRVLHVLAMLSNVVGAGLQPNTGLHDALLDDLGDLLHVGHGELCGVLEEGGGLLQLDHSRLRVTDEHLQLRAELHHDIPFLLLPRSLLVDFVDAKLGLLHQLGHLLLNNLLLAATMIELKLQHRIQLLLRFVELLGPGHPDLLQHLPDCDDGLVLLNFSLLCLHLGPLVIIDLLHGRLPRLLHVLGSLPDRILLLSLHVLLELDLVLCYLFLVLLHLSFPIFQLGLHLL
mmetsp:Transcript_92688/g.235700  ORF Transcript_92688/g.235700 Transcript_92688/m.235700 type:complete len:418 (+) Transcript_92688:1266-2519(+)